MKLEIEKVSNGYILKGECGYIVSCECESSEDIEFYKTADKDKVAIGKLLTEVAEYFGEKYNKFHRDNLKITFDRLGHKEE